MRGNHHLDEDVLTISVLIKPHHRYNPSRVYTGCAGRAPLRTIESPQLTLVRDPLHALTRDHDQRISLIRRLNVTRPSTMTRGDRLADLFSEHEVEQQEEAGEAEEVEQIEDLFVDSASASVVSPKQPRPTSSRPRTSRQTPPESPITVHSDSESSDYALRRSASRVPSRPVRLTRSAVDVKGKGKAAERMRTRQRATSEVSDGNVDRTVYETDDTESSGIEVIRVRRRRAARPVRKETLVVEIPLKPLEEIQRYSLHDSIDPPSRASRRRLTGMADRSDYASSSSAPSRKRTRTNPPARRPKWRVDSSPSINGDADIMDGVFESASDDVGFRDEVSDSDSEDMGDSDSDGVALRRSGRVRRELRLDPSSRVSSKASRWFPPSDLSL
jgi:hypothetical protein